MSSAHDTRGNQSRNCGAIKPTFDGPRTGGSLAPDLAAAIEAEADAAAAAVRARRTVDALLARKEPAPAPEESALLTPAQLARRLSISVATVRRWENPPSVCVGDESTRRYDIDAVRAWLAAREPKPTTPARRAKGDDVDVESVLSRGGLRAIGGGAR